MPLANSLPGGSSWRVQGRTAHKHLRLDSIELKRAQEPLQARRETEAVERPLALLSRSTSTTSRLRRGIADRLLSLHSPAGVIPLQITGKGQVTIPQNIRNRLGLLPHTEGEFEVAGDHALIRKAGRTEGSGVRGEKALRALRGSADPRRSTDEIMALTRGSRRAGANGNDGSARSPGIPLTQLPWRPRRQQRSSGHSYQRRTMGRLHHLDYQSDGLRRGVD